jgi:hypothetical protein
MSSQYDPELGFGTPTGAAFIPLSAQFTLDVMGGAALTGDVTCRGVTRVTRGGAPVPGAAITFSVTSGVFTGPVEFPASFRAGRRVGGVVCELDAPPPVGQVVRVQLDNLLVCVPN